MSMEIFLRGMLSGFLALILAWAVFSQYDNEIGHDAANDGGQKYLPYLNSLLLPVCFLLLPILAYHEYGKADALRMILSGCFSVFPHIALYYLILMPLLPWLRKTISARSCAMLWLIPNYLYILYYGTMELPSPKLVVTAPGHTVWIALGIWFMGFAVVMVWKIAEHLIFRRRILRDAEPVTNPVVLSVWKGLIEDANFRKPKFRLVSSPAVSTPLTIGLFRRATRVVLPERKYARADLELILRHEIIHIGREDASSKFFMVFCTAICWFNPLMWVAMRKSADDLELSCDETVLLDADEATRKRYALLLLDTAGDERGFTTCLSATAKAMRYRLKSVTKPGKRRSGALLIGVVFFVLCMTSGYVSLAYNGSTGAQMLYQGQDYSGYSVQHLMESKGDSQIEYTLLDEAAFHDYLAELTVYEMTGSYSFSDSRRNLDCVMKPPTGMGTQVYTLHDNVIELLWLHQVDRPTEYYYVPDGLDWDFIDSLLIPSSG